MAAEAGDRNSMFVVANAYHTGVGLPRSRYNLEILSL